MLNINTRISLSRIAKRKIKKFKKLNGGSLDVHSWGKINKSVKNELSKKLLINQNYKCAYCERYLLGLGHEIDHFAHKAHNSIFTFSPINLFYSCHFCNSSSRKGQKNVVENFNDRYSLCTFSIVHPYRNDVDTEIRYQDIDRINFDWNSCSLLGQATITFFGFGDLEMTMIRSRTLMFERLNPLTSDQEKLLIFKAVSYV